MGPSTWRRRRRFAAERRRRQPHPRRAAAARDHQAGAAGLIGLEPGRVAPDPSRIPHCHMPTFSCRAKSSSAWYSGEVAHPARTISRFRFRSPAAQRTNGAPCSRVDRPSRSPACTRSGRRGAPRGDVAEVGVVVAVPAEAFGTLRHRLDARQAQVLPVDGDGLAIDCLGVADPLAGPRRAGERDEEQGERKGSPMPHDRLRMSLVAVGSISSSLS